jgi:hypothetical protein
MITSRFTDSGWLQVTVQSDQAIEEIESFQARVTNSELKDFISCLDETLRRISWIESNYHTDTEAKEVYNHADVIRVGSFVVVAYLSIFRVHLIFRTSTMFLAIEELEGLLSSLKDLLGT